MVAWVTNTTRPVFPDDLAPDADGLVALGADVDPETLLEAYPKGLFPWTGKPPVPWYSPDPRMVLVPGEVKITRSLAKRRRRGEYEIRVDTAFTDVMLGCALTPRRGQFGTWITPSMLHSYTTLHRLGVAHSVEAWQDGRLVGGLYGLALGAAFFGESMFARAPDASKLALVSLCERLHDRGFAFVDCQQVTPHLARMGARPIRRAEYLRRLGMAVRATDAW